jgi:hypothetical protein
MRIIETNLLTILGTMVDQAIYDKHADRYTIPRETFEAVLDYWWAKRRAVEQAKERAYSDLVRAIELDA